MRILVYGAGVIGANLAADLVASGRDVTLLARGAWADTLAQNGLTIRPVFSLRKRTWRIPVIRELKSDDAYDVIFVVMRYTQLDSVIPVLQNNVSKNIALIGNDPCAPAYREKLKGKNVLFGFYMAAGHREPDRVVSISLKKITIGQLRDDPANEDLIRRIFDGTKIKAIYEPNMEDYLLCHAAFVMPIGFACYHSDGDLKKISRDKVYLHRIIDANIEGYQAIESAGHEILPVRGNLQTRLRKLDEGQYGALVLAAAGLKRLGLESRIHRYFTVEESIPAAGQGILGVQGRAGSGWISQAS